MFLIFIDQPLRRYFEFSVAFLILNFSNNPYNMTKLNFYKAPTRDCLVYLKFLCKSQRSVNGTRNFWLDIRIYIWIIVVKLSYSIVMCLREKIMSHLIFAILELHITSNHKKIKCYASHQQRDIYMLNHELFLGKYYEIVYCLFVI